MKEEALAKIAKMVRRLSSENDGEVVAVVRAIGRTLLAEKASFHDLADVITGDGMDARTQTVIRLCQDCLAKIELQPHERKFLGSMVRNLELNPDFQLTAKQSQWLGVLFQKMQQARGAQAG